MRARARPAAPADVATRDRIRKGRNPPNEIAVHRPAHEHDRAAVRLQVCEICLAVVAIDDPHLAGGQRCSGLRVPRVRLFADLSQHLHRSRIKVIVGAVNDQR